MVAERSYGQDEQVMISYGLKSSAECLEDHGTVPDIDMDEGDLQSIDMDNSYTLIIGVYVN